jgi:uncharacterized OB-fold protein
MEQRSFNDVAFETFLNEDKLMGSRCTSCGKLFVPPRPICIACSGTDMEWVQVKGDGKLSAFTCIAVGPPSMKEEGYTRDHPYCTGVVELEEGPRVVARIEDVDTTDPEAIKVGMPLTVKFLHRGEGERSRTLLAFNPR